MGKKKNRKKSEGGGDEGLPDFQQDKMYISHLKLSPLRNNSEAKSTEIKKKYEL